jgi:hypothetical protein
VDDAGFQMFRRAKLALDAVPSDVLARAVETGELLARVGFTDQKGHPACADLRTRGIEWSAGSGE